jgi:hypothetical protein
MCVRCGAVCTGPCAGQVHSGRCGRQTRLSEGRSHRRRHSPRQTRSRTAGRAAAMMPQCALPPIRWPADRTLSVSVFVCVCCVCSFRRVRCGAKPANRSFSTICLNSILCTALSTHAHRRISARPVAAVRLALYARYRLRSSLILCRVCRVCLCAAVVQVIRVLTVWSSVARGTTPISWCTPSKCATLSSATMQTKRPLITSENSAHIACAHTTHNSTGKRVRPPQRYHPHAIRLC